MADNPTPEPGQGGADPNPNPNPSPDPSPSPSPDPAPAPEPKAFHEQLSDPALQQWAQGKGWKDAESAVKSAFHLEKMVGAPAEQIVRLPREGDTQAREEFYNRLGRPESPDKYEMDKREGLEFGEKHETWEKNLYHKLGLTAEQVKGLTSERNNYLLQQQEEAKQQYEQFVAAEENDLKRTWGNGYERQMSLAKNAAEQLGFDEDILGAIESAKGFKSTMEFMAELGQKLGEDNFVSGNNTGGGAGGGFNSQLTPEQARAAVSQFTSDPDNQAAMMDKWHPRHKEVLERKAQLNALAYPED